MKDLLGKEIKVGDYCLVHDGLVMAPGIVAAIGIRHLTIAKLVKTATGWRLTRVPESFMTPDEISVVPDEMFGPDIRNLLAPGDA